MQEADRALPNLKLPEFRPFFEGLKQGRLVLPACPQCGPFFYPRILCPVCHRRTDDWRAMSGLGSLYSFAISHVALHPEWKAELPFVLAMVELDEGPRLSTNLVGVRPDPKEIRIGMAVEFVPARITDEVTLAHFRPVTGAGN